MKNQINTHACKQASKQATKRINQTGYDEETQRFSPHIRRINKNRCRTLAAGKYSLLVLHKQMNKFRFGMPFISAFVVPAPTIRFRWPYDVQM